jgi:hypothetical protein
MIPRLRNCSEHSVFDSLPTLCAASSTVITRATGRAVARLHVVRFARREYAAAVSDLERIDFGLGAAQQERHLTNYFYRSGSFKLACSDKTYLILGAKGAGKSAIFRCCKSCIGKSQFCSRRICG